MSAKYKYPTPWWKRILIFLLLPFYPIVLLFWVIGWFCQVPLCELFTTCWKDLRKMLPQMWDTFVALLAVVFLNRNLIAENIEAENKRRKEAFYNSLPNYQKYKEGK